VGEISLFRPQLLHKRQGLVQVHMGRMGFTAYNTEDKHIQVLQER